MVPTRSSPKLCSPSKIPVPEQQVCAAISSIKNTIDAYRHQVSVFDQVTVNARRSDLVKNILNQIQDILTSQITAAVNPVPIEEYTTSYVPYSSPVRLQFSGDHQKNLAKNDDDSDSLSVPEDDESDDSFANVEEEEMEEEDLLDQDALSRARLLRTQVRQAALRNQSIAEAQLERTARLLSHELSSARQLLVASATINPENMPTQDRSTEDDEKINCLQSCLDSLLKTLNDIERSLPSKLESLQTTIQTVEHYLHKNHEQDDNRDGNSNICRIERSITSRDGESRKRWLATTNGTKNDLRQDETAISRKLNDMRPEKRLALFLANNS